MICNYTANCMHQVYTYKRKVQCLDLPLAVLTDGGSASASEIIVGCLKDSNRAAVLGERTYGKGLAQGVSNSAVYHSLLVFVFGCIGCSRALRCSVSSAHVASILLQ
jgi:Peptidase family S41